MWYFPHAQNYYLQNIYPTIHTRNDIEDTLVVCCLMNRVNIDQGLMYTYPFALEALDSFWSFQEEYWMYWICKAPDEDQRAVLQECGGQIHAIIILNILSARHSYNAYKTQTGIYCQLMPALHTDFRCTGQHQLVQE